MELPSKSSVYRRLTEAALKGNNIEFLEQHRLLNVLLITESDGEVSEQARISSEIFKITKELISSKGDGALEELVDSPIGSIGLGDISD